MGDIKTDVEAGESGQKAAKVYDLPCLPKSLTLEEKKYLLAVERGDMANVRRMLQRAHRKKHIDINCLDSLGRGALTLAIDSENLEMVELLVIMEVETRDALLQSINVEFVEAVELLLEHEELIHKEGEPYSWQKVDTNIGMFTPDITPLILAAHRNNYEIIKILLDRGATLPLPHDIKCGCEECIAKSSEDSLRHSLSRVNEYRALASPSLIALSSSDPILTAFQLSWELRTLAFAEQESKSEYLELRRQCQQFAVDLLHQSRSSQELAIILNHDPEDPPYEDGEHMKLARLELAINYKQKKFVAHPNIQQLLAAIWYEGVPGFRRKKAAEKIYIIVKVALLFPMYCTLYMCAPNCSTGKLMRKPFMKFLIHASSYLFFLLILILVSLRADVQVIQLFGTDSMKKKLEEDLMRQRGNGPSYLELIVVVYVLGFIWEETQEIYLEGMQSYLRNMWNFIDFTRNSLYVAVALLRFAAFIQQSGEIAKDPKTVYIPREHWDAFDPQLIAEGLFAAANIFSALKLVHLFSINPHLGPLQISLGRMVIDIVKFFFIYSLVLFAFACGLNQLLYYFAELEKKKCYVLPGGLPDWDNASDSCMKWRSFGNVFEASQSLFWASFGMVGLENFELAGIKSYTRFWGLLMFGSYSVINVIVLLNLLIAMMSNSYAMIDEHSDVEWKFARTRLWMSYFEQGATLPPPFNILPTPKLLFKILGLRKKDKLNRMNAKSRDKEEKDMDIRYTAVTRALVWRYVSAMHRKCDEEPVTEDDINEVKADISTMRYEMLEVFEKNGMDVSFTDRKEKAVLGKRMKVWERRLMKDFHLAPVAIEEEGDTNQTLAVIQPPPEGEDSLSRFRRVAKLAASTSSSSKWGQVMKGVCVSSQIGRCRSRESFKNQQNLQKAMDEARKLVLRSPLPGGSRCASPIELPDTTGSCIMELLQNIKDEVEEEAEASRPKKIWKPPGAAQTLSVTSATKSRPTSPSISLGVKSAAASKAPTPKAVTPITSPKKVTPITSPKSVKPITSPNSVTPITSPKVLSPVASLKGGPTPITSPKSVRSADDKKSLSGTSATLVETTIIDETKPSTSEDPCPLIQPKRVPGESPPKVIKRKAPSPALEEAIAISRPIGVEIKPLEGGLPPPPPNPKKTEPLPTPSVEVTPAQTSPKAKERVSSPTSPPVSIRSQSPTPSSSAAVAPSETLASRSASPTPVVIVTPQASGSTSTPASPEKNSIIMPGARLSSTSSTEQLIPSSPQCLRPINKIDDVKTIKRQPKTGWL
ncbi:transient receptor potential-like [Arctopsyche grandis]|uniref:transient receptor potential-like n=1 Tax=Arctopsyche grandis TaxID=121162 RepID=UPI00406D7152